MQQRFASLMRFQSYGKNQTINGNLTKADIDSRHYCMSVNRISL